MKTILAAVAMVALLGGLLLCPGGREWEVEPGDRTRQEKETEEQKKKLEEDYKRASDSIPEPKVKFDPWKNARS